MILINFVQAIFVSFLVYLVTSLADHRWYEISFYLEVLAICFVVGIVYDVILDKVINWFNREDTFRG